MRKIYLDYAAATPVDLDVLKAVLPYFTKEFGNTVSMHYLGQAAKAALEESREILVKAIGAQANEILFTASATESNNLALKGLALANRKKGNHIIISPVEHSSVRESAKWLEGQGFKVSVLRADSFGRVDPKDVEKAITNQTILVSVVHGSNEMGTIEPIAEIGYVCRKKKILFHSDASQSFGKIKVNVNDLNVDLLTICSPKIYGPKGAALLYVKEGVKIDPLLHGGGQEMGLRSSTVNLPAIVGFAKASQIVSEKLEKEGRRLEKLRDKLIQGVLKLKSSHLTGHPTERLPNLASFWFEGFSGDSLVVQLDLEGIAVSTGSACHVVKSEPSYSLIALGLKPDQAKGALRISLGRWTTEREIDYLVKTLKKIIK